MVPVSMKTKLDHALELAKELNDEAWISVCEINSDVDKLSSMYWHYMAKKNPDQASVYDAQRVRRQRDLDAAQALFDATSVHLRKLERRDERQRLRRQAAGGAA